MMVCIAATAARYRTVALLMSKASYLQSTNKTNHLTHSSNSNVMKIPLGSTSAVPIMNTEFRSRCVFFSICKQLQSSAKFKNHVFIVNLRITLFQHHKIPIRLCQLEEFAVVAFPLFLFLPVLFIRNWYLRTTATKPYLILLVLNPLLVRNVYIICLCICLFLHKILL